MGLLHTWLLAAVVAQPQPASTPDAPAHRVTEEIRLDGVLDEPAWASVPTIGRLLQQEPTPESEPTMETEVRVLFDRDHLYFGILCRDHDPSAIVANQLSRDADLESDDVLVVVVDPFLDCRNGFFFETNPAGARADGQVTNNAEERTLEWDGIWDAAARVTDDGWVAEIEIPFKTPPVQAGPDDLGPQRRAHRPAVERGRSLGLAPAGDLAEQPRDGGPADGSRRHPPGSGAGRSPLRLTQPRGR